MSRPTDSDALLDRAEVALEHGDIDLTLDLCREVLAREPDNVGAWFLEAEAWRDVGVLEDAEAAYRAVIQRDPTHGPAFSGLGAVLFDQLRFEESRTALLRALRADDGNPEAYYWRAMLRERRGDDRGALRDYRRANTLDPAAYPLPVPLDEATVEAIVSDVLLAVHPTLRHYLAQLVILLEEVPDEELCRTYDPPAPPGEILGVFSGHALTERSYLDASGVVPATIVLFRRNLERIAEDRERLLEELRITVFHEIGHFLGLDEDDLEKRGLD